MKTRCPKCHTRYNVAPEALLAADGLARCFRCGTVFDAVAEDASASSTADRHGYHDLTLDDQADLPGTTEDEARDLPFEVPDDLEPLLPSEQGALDVVDTLYEKKSRRGFFYGLIAVLLLLALGAQFAWHYRTEIVAQYPVLEPLCQHVECRPSIVRAPHRFRVLQRDMRPTENEPGSLTLHLRFSNEAEVAQPLPDIQLALLDNNGSVLIRRRLAPAEYLYPAPPQDTVVAAGEVVTIDIDFEDPGYLATGFEIEFL